ncbi:hypothetical protein [Nesterenkonia sandarakina]|uniref:Uncharacterized protein n=1 Tax=Nesterenkonia sandarakina TaxID=272918 RepID=A0A2T0YQ22_9MICC|nr:hypothetical protein [Nesterenkonia sandarakina]PRZ17514.1 hypothetical protein BCL67_10560 [Nesterenkonia sandarakina]
MTAPLAFTAAAPAAPDTPDWAPLVFGIASLLVLVLVIVLARRKMNESAQWRQRSQEDVDPDDPQRGPRKGPQENPPRNDDA